MNKKPGLAGFFVFGVAKARKKRDLTEVFNDFDAVTRGISREEKNMGKHFQFTGVMCAAMLLFSACMTSSGGGDNGNGNPNGEGKTDITFSMDILDHDAEARVLVIREVNYECDGQGAVADTTIDTLHYLVEAGTLYLWEAGSCILDMKATGSSTTIFGTWVAASLDVQDSVPPAHRPEQCPEDWEEESVLSKAHEEGEDDDIFGDATMDITISESEISVEVSGQLCFAQMMGTLFSLFSEHVEVESSGCELVELSNTETGESASFSSSFNSDGSYSLTFTHEGGTCTAMDVMDFPGIMPLCSENGGEDVFETLGDCAFESGFFDGEEGSFVSLGKSML